MNFNNSEAKQKIYKVTGTYFDGPYVLDSTVDFANKADFVIFQTEDGATLTSDSDFWVVCLKRISLVSTKAFSYPSFSKNKSKYLRFSSLEHAQGYINLNKKLLCVKDIKDCLSLGDMTSVYHHLFNLAEKRAKEGRFLNLNL